MKDLKLISCIPDNSNFLWQTAVNLLNARTYGFSDKAQVLIFLSEDQLHKGFNGKWKFLEKKFPETSFFYYPDTQRVTKIMTTYNYIPAHRLWMLKEHWKLFPELQESTIYYHDSDTVFTQYPTFLDSLRDDSINYLSDTKTYLNTDYFEGKVKDTLPEKLEDYKQIDLIARIANITKSKPEDWYNNKNNTGGAQYLLKDVDQQFWIDCMAHCLALRTYLIDINQRFFESEDKGIQSWVSDMISLLGNLWARNRTVITPPEMNFAWATEYTDSWNRNTIYHDASASPDPTFKDGKEFRTFFKRGNRIKLGGSDFYDYILDWEAPMLKTPFDDDLSYVSPELCSYLYIKEIEKCKDFLFK